MSGLLGGVQFSKRKTGFCILENSLRGLLRKMLLKSSIRLME